MPASAHTLHVDLVTFDPGVPVPDAHAYVEAVVARVEHSWQTGADVVLLPEFTWMGLEPFCTQGDDKTLHHIAESFEQIWLPKIESRLALHGKCVVLGTAPKLLSDGGIANRAIIFSEGRQLHQDKLHLTPWENAFTPGDTLHLWTFAGFRIAVIICLDIEIPELSARLRDSEVDLILCPSATESILGVERVNRCASARAVELGCYVGVSHLTGHAASDLIDNNIGKAALYRPSQSAFKKAQRLQETEIHESGSHTLRVTLEKHPLEVMRRMKIETNPSHLGRKLAGIERTIHVQCDVLP
ncbi:MAG: nitrilase-related carbon-nitrogen hydrolase [Verrucomicrobiota bacterium]